MFIYLLISAVTNGAWSSNLQQQNVSTKGEHKKVGMLTERGVSLGPSGFRPLALLLRARSLPW
eukprot:2717501-Pyramimonas_sp.AAC.1